MKVGKVRRWFFGFRLAATAWEAHYATKLEEVGSGGGRRQQCLSTARRRTSTWWATVRRWSS